MSILTFRDAFREISPRWLRGTFLGGLLFAIGTVFDSLQSQIQDAVALRYPDPDRPDALALLGTDRKIERGNNETDASYSLRLERWLTDHAKRGGPYAMLRQLYAHYLDNPFEIQLIYFSGRRFTLDVSGTITEDTIAWAPDASRGFMRWTMLYDWPGGAVDDGAWGDPGLWGDDGAWGSNLTLAEIADVKLVPTAWNAAHCTGRIVLGAYGSLWGAPPDLWGDGGVWGSNVAAIEIR